MLVSSIVLKNICRVRDKMVVFALTLIRHGETGHNKDNVIQGQLDVPLSPTGLHQAQLLGCHLQHQQYTHMYVSDLTRAKQTAENVIKQNHLYKGTLIHDHRLRERKFGVVEGKSFKYLKEAAAKANQPVNQFTPIGGETVQQVHSRAVAFFDDLCRMVNERSKLECLPECIVNGSIAVNSNSQHPEQSGEGKFVSQKRKRENSETDVASKAECPGKSNAHLNQKNLSPKEIKGNAVHHNIVNSTECSVLNECISSTSCEENLQLPESSDFFNCGDISKHLNTIVSADHKNVVKLDCLKPMEEPINIKSDQFSVTFADDVIRSHINSCCNDPLSTECPNVSLSPLVDHTLLAQSAVCGIIQEKGHTNGQTERRLSVCSSCDDTDTGPVLMANVLVVSHGGLLRELFRHFVEDLECTVPGGRKQALRISPNAGLSKFTVSIEESDGHPKIICHQIHDKQHLLNDLSINSVINGDDIAL